MGLYDIKLYLFIINKINCFFELYNRINKFNSLGHTDTLKHESVNNSGVDYNNYNS